MLTSTAAVVTLDPITKTDALRAAPMMTPQGFASLVLSHDADIQRRHATMHETIVRAFLEMGHGPALDTLSTTVTKAGAVYKAFENGEPLPADTLGCVNKAQANSVRATASTYKAIIGAVYCGLIDADMVIDAGRSEAYDLARAALADAGLKPDGTTVADAENKRHAAKVRKAAKDAGMSFDASMTPEEFAAAKAKAEELVADELAKADIAARMKKAEKLIASLLDVIGDNADIRKAVLEKLSGRAKAEAAPF